VFGSIIAAHASAIAANKVLFDGCIISSPPFYIQPGHILQHTQACPVSANLTPELNDLLGSHPVTIL
jgi:hypothetical protein